MPKIKICGLRRLEDIFYVNAARPDYAGFILSPGYRRSVSLETAQKLKRALHPSIQAVGVFVNADLSYIKAYVDAGVIDMVQLHGDESPAFCRQIDFAPVIKAFICSADTAAQIEAYETDYFLFDTGRGGGQALHLSLVPKTDRPFFLAGGLDETRINAIRTKIDPYGFDLSSAVETDGQKDKEKVMRVVRSIRNG